MRRAPIVIMSTAVGLGGVLGFKAREPAPAQRAAATAGPSTTASSAKATTKTRTGSGASSGTKTATGDSIPTQYGNAQVRATVSGGQITKIVALQLQGNDPKSVQISSYAEPILQQSALAKQTAAVDVVSGASYTSASYEASLQSALDRLGFKAADGSRATVS